MPGITEDRKRNVVPRWRTFDSTLQRRELGPLLGENAPKTPDNTLDELVKDWKDTPTLSVAADLVSVAFTMARYGVATDAAQYIVSAKAAPPASQKVALIYLNKGEISTNTPEFSDDDLSIPSGSDPLGPFQRRMYVRVHEIRDELKQYPYNPILWANLARLHLTLGCPEKATRAMQVALAMAPENRFLLRAASRLYLHQREKERAHLLLARAPRLRSDPWLLAAEIATADSRGRTSRNISLARKVIENGRYAPHHVSELASALATLELKAGKRRSGKRFVDLSLEDPTENAIAQAAWLARNIAFVRMRDEHQLTASSEANAYLAQKTRQWDLALSETFQWQVDQPFSSRPAIHGSFIASSILENYELAIAFAEQGLLSNPDEAVLYNNLAFAQALNNQPEDALKTLDRVRDVSVPKLAQIFLSATRGLVAYRLGQHALGRRYYEQAIALARGDLATEAAARIHLALEELRVRSYEAERLRAEAIQLASTVDDPALEVLSKRLAGVKQITVDTHHTNTFPLPCSLDTPEPHPRALPPPAEDKQ
jgi:tetratricopeptide (TPR) repeat protein